MQNFFSKYVLQFYYSYYMIHSLLNLRMWNTERSDYKVMHKFSTAQELVFFTPMFFQERESLQTCWPPPLPSGKIQNASSFLIGRFFLSCVGGCFFLLHCFQGVRRDIDCFYVYLHLQGVTSKTSPLSLVPSLLRRKNLDGHA